MVLVLNILASAKLILRAMTVIICGSSRAKLILVIAQEVVPVQVFYNLLGYYWFEEFADATKVLNGSMLHEYSPAFLKREDTVETFHRFGKHVFFKQELNSIPNIGDNTGLAFTRKTAAILSGPVLFGHLKYKIHVLGVSI